MKPTEQPSLNTAFHRYYQRLQPALKKPKNRATTTAVFSFLAISLFGLYAIRPTAQTIIYLRREIADKTTLNQQMENKITALIEAQATYETIRDRVDVIEQALPDNPDALILARQLRNLANISGASIAAMQIPSLPIIAQEATPGARTAVAAAKPLEEFPVTLVVAGPYAAIETFLDGLLKMRRITNVDTISMKRTFKLGSSSDILQLNVRLKSFYSRQ